MRLIIRKIKIQTPVTKLQSHKKTVRFLAHNTLKTNRKKLQTGSTSINTQISNPQCRRNSYLRIFMAHSQKWMAFNQK